MTTSNINPVADSLVLHGDSFSFDLDDGGVTPSFFTVIVYGASTELAWALGAGFQPGFTGSAIKVGNVYTITVRRTAGWDASPFQVDVDWIISGTSSSTSWNYELAVEQQYPDLMKPRNPIAQGTLIVTDDGAAALTDCGWIDFVGATVTPLGNGKVKVEFSGGGSGTSFHGFGEWEFDTTITKADPGSGKFRLNNATQGSASELYISQEDRSGAVLDDALNSLQSGDTIRLQSETQAQVQVYTVNGTVVDEGTYKTVPIAWVSAGASDLVNADTCSLYILRAVPTAATSDGLARVTFAAGGGTPGTAEVTTNTTNWTAVATIQIHERDLDTNNIMTPWYDRLRVGDHIGLRESTPGGFGSSTSGNFLIDSISYAANVYTIGVTPYANNGGTPLAGDVYEVFLGFTKDAAGANEDRIDTLYVAKDGSDSNDGKNHEVPFLTIGAAITAASALTPAENNVIAIQVLDSGIYNEAITVPEYVEVYAPHAELEQTTGTSACLTVEGHTHVEFRAITHSGGAGGTCVARATGATGTAKVKVNEVNVNGAATWGATNFSAIGGVLFIEADQIFVDSTGTGIAVGDITSGVGHIHATVGDIYLQSNTSYGIVRAGTGTTVANVDHILETGSPTGTVGILAAAGVVTANVRTISVDTAWSISAGATLNLFVNESTGTETETGTANITKAGATGAAGVEQPFAQWTINNGSATPASGEAGLQNGVAGTPTNWSQVQHVFFHETDADSTNLVWWLFRAEVNDYLLLRDATDRTKYLHCQITAITDAGAYYDVTVTALTSNGAITDTNKMVVSHQARHRTAIHDDEAGEISALSLVTVASGDHVLIEDASDSNNKKRIAASDFLAGGAAVQTRCITGIPNPAQDNWRTWGNDSGYMNDVIWAQAVSSSGTGSISVDPSVERYGNGLYFPAAATIEDVTLYITPGSAHSSFSITYDMWKIPIADGDTASAAATRIFRESITMDGTSNKVYIKTPTLDTASIAAGDMLMLYFATPDAAGNGEQQRFNLTLRYTET